MKTYSFDYSVDSDSTYSRVLDYPLNGYTPVGIMEYNVGNYGLNLATLTTALVALSNNTPVKISGKFSVRILYLKKI